MNSIYVNRIFCFYFLFLLELFFSLNLSFHLFLRNWGDKLVVMRGTWIQGWISYLCLIVIVCAYLCLQSAIRKMKNRLLDFLDVGIIFLGEVILLTAIIYSIWMITSIVLNTIGWYNLGRFFQAFTEISANVLGWFDFNDLLLMVRYDLVDIKVICCIIDYMILKKYNI